MSIGLLVASGSHPARAGLIAHYDFADGDLLDNEVGGNYALAEAQAGGTTAHVTLETIDTVGTARFSGGSSASVPIAWLQTVAGITPADFTVSFWFRTEMPISAENFTGLFASESSGPQEAGDWQIDSRGGNSGEFGFLAGQNSPSLVSSFIPRADAWYHVAVRKDNDAAKPLQVYITEPGGTIGAPVMEDAINTMDFDKFCLGINRGGSRSYTMNMANVKIFDDSEVSLDDLLGELAVTNAPVVPESSRTWLGPEYWANRLQDWQRVDDRIDCLMDGKDRTVHNLTWQLDTTSALTTRVAVTRIQSGFDGYAGFRFAKHGDILDEYRHNCIYGSGMDAGIKADGSLFVGSQSVATNWPTGEQRILELSLTPGGGQHTALLRMLDATSNQLAQVQELVSSTNVHGNIALVCHASSNGAHGNRVVSFEDWTIQGANLRGGGHQNWGPILWAQYTLSSNVLKLAAQFVPISTNDEHTAALDLWQDGAWVEANSAEIDDMARIALFRVDPWTATSNVSYRVRYRLDGSESTYGGTIRRDPIDEAELSVAGFTGNKDYGFPNLEIVQRVGALDPDLLFFSGDQIYEDVGRFGVQRSPLAEATLDYLRKWYLVGWAFGDLIRNRPSVFLPDDHDVYQGNIWGSGGEAAADQRDGGYTMNPVWVNMVQRTHTAHFPDPYDPTPIEQGITVYYTSLVYGRVSFAILEDRKFKNGPNEVEPTGGIPVADADQLGDRQLAFLRSWAQDWRGCDMKATLSQTVFAQCHTHSSSGGSRINMDKDSNGWPPPARDDSVREIRKAFAFMYAGDNHLPTIAHHGVDDWEDAGVSFTVPSIAAGFPRKWEPASTTKVRASGGPDYAAANLSRPGATNYLGRYIGDHGHHLTMVAAANPDVWRGDSVPGDIDMLNEKSSGFGFVRFNKETRDITIECWRINGDLGDPDVGQHTDWPLTINQMDNYGRDVFAYLPAVENVGMTNPVVQVINEQNSEILYTLRTRGTHFRPHVFSWGSYTVRYGEPDTGTWFTRPGLKPLPGTVIFAR